MHPASRSFQNWTMHIHSVATSFHVTCAKNLDSKLLQLLLWFEGPLNAISSHTCIQQTPQHNFSRQRYLPSRLHEPSMQISNQELYWKDFSLVRWCYFYQRRPSSSYPWTLISRQSLMCFVHPHPYFSPGSSKFSSPCSSKFSAKWGNEIYFAKNWHAFIFYCTSFCKLGTTSVQVLTIGQAEWLCMAWRFEWLCITRS